MARDRLIAGGAPLHRSAIYIEYPVAMRPTAVRMAVSVYVFALTAFASAYAYWWRTWPSDFWQVWMGAQALLAGRNPYHEPLVWATAEGVRTWPWPQLYPVPAFLVAIPTTVLPMGAVNPLVSGLGGALLAYALTARGPKHPSLLVFLSAPYLFMVNGTQWSALLTAGALLPWGGFLLACKPSIGAALWCAYPSWRTTILVAAVVLLSLIVAPGWPIEWLQALPGMDHAQAPVTLPGGFLILTALLRWRRPEARLVAALGLVPQTMSLYELVPLFLVVQRWREAWLLWACTAAAFALGRIDGSFIGNAQWVVWLGYLPAVAIVLLQPNADAAVSAGRRRPFAFWQQVGGLRTSRRETLGNVGKS